MALASGKANRWTRTMTSRSLTHPINSLMMSGCAEGALLKLGIGSSYFASIEALGRATSTKKIMRALNAKTTNQLMAALEILQESQIRF